MTTPPAQAAATAQRSRLSMPEAMVRLGWTENDLKDAIISGYIVPSIFVKGAVWPMPVGTNGRRDRAKTAIYANYWMFAVGIRPIGPFDCQFDFLANTTDALECSACVYVLDSNGFVKVRTTLSEIMESGTVDMEQLRKLEAGPAHSPLAQQLSSSDSVSGKWWHTEYDPWSLAKAIEEEAVGRGWGTNQRGRRAGRYPLSTLSAEVATKINGTEAATPRKREIGAKTIENFLKSTGWK